MQSEWGSEVPPLTDPIAMRVFPSYDVDPKAVPAGSRVFRFRSGPEACLQALRHYNSSIKALEQVGGCGMRASPSWPEAWAVAQPGQGRARARRQGRSDLSPRWRQPHSARDRRAHYVDVSGYSVCASVPVVAGYRRARRKPSRSGIHRGAAH